MPLSTPPPILPPDLWTFAIVMTISILSGLVSITRRLVRGTPFSAVWFIGEFLAAILCGWLAYDAYERVQLYLPDWVTLPVFIAISAHTGGRLLQVGEHMMRRKLPKDPPDDEAEPPPV